MNNEERNSIVELPIDVIDQFPKHHYKVKDDDDMLQLIESIKENGVITPIIVRPKPKGRYEMISGHRRLQACRHLGHMTIRDQVLELDKNAATVMMVDEGKIAMRPAVEISYLPEKLQNKLADCILKEDATPSHDQTIRMSKLLKEGLLTEEAIDGIMHELKPNQTNRIYLSEDKVKKFMPKNMPVSKREDYILKALEHYDKYLKKQKSMER